MGTWKCCEGIGEGLGWSLENMKREQQARKSGKSPDSLYYTRYSAAIPFLNFARFTLLALPDSLCPATLSTRMSSIHSTTQCILLRFILPRDHRDPFYCGSFYCLVRFTLPRFYAYCPIHNQCPRPPHLIAGFAASMLGGELQTCDVSSALG